MRYLPAIWIVLLFSCFGNEEQAVPVQEEPAEESIYDFVHDCMGEDEKYTAVEGLDTLRSASLDSTVNQPDTLNHGPLCRCGFHPIGYYLKNSSRKYEYQDTPRSYIGYRPVMTYLPRGGSDSL